MSESVDDFSLLMEIATYTSYLHTINRSGVKFVTVLVLIFLNTSQREMNIRLKPPNINFIYRTISTVHSTSILQEKV